MTNEEINVMKYKIRKSELLRRRKMHWQTRIEMKKELQAAMAEAPRIFKEALEHCKRG